MIALFALSYEAFSKTTSPFNIHIHLLDCHIARSRQRELFPDEIRLNSDKRKELTSSLMPVIDDLFDRRVINDNASICK